MLDKISTKRRYILIIIFCFLLLSLQLYPSNKKLFYLNLSASFPRGIYRIQKFKISDIQPGVVVIFDPPPVARPLIYGRGWLPSGWPLIKYVGAVSGDTYAVEGSRFFINGKHVGQVFTGDSEGKPLSFIKGTVKVKPGEFLPVSTHISNSFDGRYFGPVSLSAIRGKATPVWTY